MSMKAPFECVAAIAQGGKAKSEQPLIASLLLGFLAGAYIAIGGLFAIKAAGSLPPEVWGSFQKLVFAGVFPAGLLMVIVGGADLFTGNCSAVTTGLYFGIAKPLGLIRSWVLSWSTNLVGSIFVVFVLGYLSGTIMEAGPNGTFPFANYIVKLANAKCALPWDQAFLRGVGCNWLVCLAIFMAASADTVPGKAVAFWMPITAFVAIGWEHSVANMAFIPLGIFAGSDPSYINAVTASGMTGLTADWHKFFFTNLLPVTLGNIVGAVVFVASIYFGVFGKKAKACINC